MNNLLKDHEGTSAFIENIIVYVETSEVHEQRRKRVLEMLKDARLKLEEKCKLRQTPQATWLTSMVSDLTQKRCHKKHLAATEH